MSKEIYIFEVSDTSFDQVVVDNSHKLPVITLFLGVWSEPCFVLSEIFSKLAKEFAGQFIFAKVDIDEQQKLRDRFMIQNIPTIKVFQAGEVTLSEEGLLTDDEARLLLKGLHVFHLSDAMREEAREKHLQGDTEAAVILLGKAIQEDPANTRVALDMVQIFIDINQIEQANELFNKLPQAARDTDMGKSITGQLSFKNLAAGKDSIESLKQQLMNNADDKQARFDLAICLTAEYEVEQAIENLFELHIQDASFQDGAAKELLVTLINMLKTTRPDLAKSTQTRLSSLLAS